MNLQTKGTRYEPTPDILTQAEKQVGGLARFIDESQSEAQAMLELSQEVGSKQNGDIWKAELTIVHEGRTFRAVSIKTKLANALTTVSRDVGGELRREHKRMNDRKRKGGEVVKAFLRGFGG